MLSLNNVFGFMVSYNLKNIDKKNPVFFTGSFNCHMYFLFYYLEILRRYSCFMKFIKESNLFEFVSWRYETITSRFILEVLLYLVLQVSYWVFVMINIGIIFYYYMQLLRCLSFKIIIILIFYYEMKKRS